MNNNKLLKIKKILLQRILTYTEILKMEMLPDNVDKITYGDKLAAIGSLNLAIELMKEIEPSYEYDFSQLQETRQFNSNKVTYKNHYEWKTLEKIEEHEKRKNTM